jgi:hypothetical protein
MITKIKTRTIIKKIWDKKNKRNIKNQIIKKVIMQANMQQVQMKIKVKKSHHHILKMNHKP